MVAFSKDLCFPLKQCIVCELGFKLELFQEMTQADGFMFAVHGLWGLKWSTQKYFQHWQISKLSSSVHSLRAPAIMIAISLH